MVVIPARVAAQDPSAAGLYLIDAHSQADSTDVLERVLPLMERAGVRHTILSARGKLKNGAIADFARAHPTQITAAVRSKGRAYRDNTTAYFDDLNARVASGQFGAMAELLIYHAKKGERAGEVEVDLDDRRVTEALRLTHAQGWPAILHIEFASLSVGRRRTMMSDLEKLLVSNSEQALVLIHMGQLGAEEVGRLIAAHSNVYFLTSHANPHAVNRSNQPWVNMFADGGLAPHWRELVVAHPDRFILAFDNVWSHHWGDFYLEQAKLWRKALVQLPPNVAHAIAYGNAERLWRLDSEAQRP